MGNVNINNIDMPNCCDHPTFHDDDDRGFKMVRNQVTESEGTEAKLIMAGIQNSGKTAIFNLLNNIENTIDVTKGFHTSKLNHQSNNIDGQTNFIIDLWVLGGKKEVRKHWKNYYKNTEGIVFVFDSSEDDEYMIQDARETFTMLMNSKKLKKAPVLILATKQDVIGGWNLDEIVEKLEVKKSIGDRKWFIDNVSVKHGAHSPSSAVFHPIHKMNTSIFETLLRQIVANKNQNPRMSIVENKDIVQPQEPFIQEAVDTYKCEKKIIL